MNKIARTLSLTCSITLFASCMKEPENHLLDIVRPKPYGVVFADQRIDSVRFQTFDSYTVTSLSDWIWIEENNGAQIAYNPMSLYEAQTLIGFQENTTGKTRAGGVKVSSYEYETAARFYQLGCLDIYRPTYNVKSYVIGNVPLEVSFESVDSASWVADTIAFVVHNTWTLTIKQVESGDAGEDTESTGEEGTSWVHFAQNRGKAGRWVVPLTLDINENQESERKAILQLTSGSVTNEITIRQLKAKKPKEEK